MRAHSGWLALISAILLAFAVSAPAPGTTVVEDQQWLFTNTWLRTGSGHPSVYSAPALPVGPDPIQVEVELYTLTAFRWGWENLDPVNPVTGIDGTHHVQHTLRQRLGFGTEVVTEHTKWRPFYGPMQPGNNAPDLAAFDGGIDYDFTFPGPASGWTYACPGDCFVGNPTAYMEKTSTAVIDWSDLTPRQQANWRGGIDLGYSWDQWFQATVSWDSDHLWDNNWSDAKVSVRVTTRAIYQ